MKKKIKAKKIIKKKEPTTKLTEKIVDILCCKIAEGKSIRQAVIDMPEITKTSIFNWLMLGNKKDCLPIFKYLLDQYTLARRVQAEGFIDEIMEIADNGKNDWMETEDPNNGGYRYNGEAVGRSRLRVDTRKWVACKVLPKVYGDKIDLENNIKIELPVPILYDKTKEK